MRFYSFPAGSTSQTITIRIHDAATGRAKTDLVFNTANLVISYYTATGAVTAITLVTQTATGAWASGGFVHKDGGDYRLDIPNAALASSTRLEVIAKTTDAVALDIITEPVQIAVTAFDPLAAGPTEASINAAVEAGAVGTNVTAVKAKTDQLVFAASRVNANSDVSAAAVNSAVEAGAVGTNAAAIKAKTDQLVFAASRVNANSDVSAAAVNAAVEAGAVGTNAASAVSAANTAAAAASAAQASADASAALATAIKLVTDTIPAGVLLAAGALDFNQMSANVREVVKSGGTLRFTVDKTAGTITVFDLDGVTPIAVRPFTTAVRDAIESVG